MNSINRRRLELGFRSAYSSALCLLLLNFVSFGGALTYIAPVLSVISNPLFVGHWLDTMWQVTYSAVIGSISGTLIAYSWTVDINLMLFLLFIALTAINRVSCWERVPKVIGSLTCMLSAVFPSITDGETIGATCLMYMLGMSIIPYALTGISLLFPLPKLASTTALKQVTLITRNFRRIVQYLTIGFNSSESIDLYSTEADYLFKETELILDDLQVLCRYVANESIYLSSKTSRTLPSALSEFVALYVQLLEELRGIQRMLLRIPMNHTQTTFARHMKESLQAYTNNVCDILQLICDYLHSLDRYKYTTFTTLYLYLCSCLPHRSTAPLLSAPSSRDNPLGVTDTYTDDIEAVPSKLERKSTMHLNRNMSSTTESYISNFRQLNEQLQASKVTLLSQFRSVRGTYVLGLRKKKAAHTPRSPPPEPVGAPEADTIHAHESTHTDTHHSNPHTPTEPTEPPLHIADESLDQFQRENERLSTKNISPRGAYLGRLVVLLNTICCLDKVLSAQPMVHSKRRFCYQTCVFAIDYVVKAFPELYYLSIAAMWYLYYCSLYLHSSLRPADNEGMIETYLKHIHVHWKVLRPWIQPMKIAAAIVITSTLIVGKQFENTLLSQNATW